MKAESKRRAAKGWHSRGYLPHFDSPETVQHLVLRAADSLPAAAVAALPEGSRFQLQRLDEALDVGHGAGLLRQAGPASIVETAMLHFDGERYRLIAWSVMPNHVHALLAQADGFPLDGVVHSWKSFTAHEINKMCARNGQFWAADYFDRFVRDEAHFYRTVDYIEQNPVKARLAAKAADWRFSSARRRAEGDGS
jgi:REP element-mobilizing transposase RayT